MCWSTQRQGRNIWRPSTRRFSGLLSELQSGSSVHFFSLFFYEKIHFTFRYYLDTLNDPFIMDDPKCALITEQAYAYFKLSYQEKVGILQRIFDNHVKYSQDYSNPSDIVCKLLKVAHWKEKDRPSRWPKLLAALSYAEKLIEVSAFSFC